MMRFTPFPDLETHRLILRRIMPADAHDLHSMRQDPRMHQHTDTKTDRDLAETRSYIDKMNKGVDEDKWVIWAIEHKQSGKVIGTISLWNFTGDSAELGYGIIPEYQGQGLMQEALSSVTTYGFSVIQLARIDAYTEVNNIASAKLLEKSGFQRTGQVREEGQVNSRTYNMTIYSKNPNSR